MGYRKTLLDNSEKAVLKVITDLGEPSTAYRVMKEGQRLLRGGQFDFRTLETRRKGFGGVSGGFRRYVGGWTVFDFIDRVQRALGRLVKKEYVFVEEVGGKKLYSPTGKVLDSEDMPLLPQWENEEKLTLLTSPTDIVEAGVDNFGEEYEYVDFIKDRDDE